MQCKPIAAIDPSLTSTGIAFGTSADDVQVRTVGSKPMGETAADRIRRYERLMMQIQDVLQEVNPALILIEGYSFGSSNKGQMNLREFGGILRWHLVDTGKVLEVAPAGLKKFATGKGNAKKEVVLAHVVNRWGQLFERSDEADAYALYRMALVACGRCEAENEAQRESVARVLETHQMATENLRALTGGEYGF